MIEFLTITVLINICRKKHQGMLYYSQVRDKEKREKFRGFLYYSRVHDIQTSENSFFSGVKSSLDVPIPNAKKTKWEIFKIAFRLFS